jgi:undecaprenyl diphosphate synthase
VNRASNRERDDTQYPRTMRSHKPRGSGATPASRNPGCVWRRPVADATTLLPLLCVPGGGSRPRFLIGYNAALLPRGAWPGSAYYEQMNAKDTTGPHGAPQHVAFVMDGNGRWATQQGLPRLAGHRAGISRVEKVAEALLERGVRHMTIYMFSTENWRRSKEEVDGIFALLGDWLRDAGPRLRQKGVVFRHLGRREPLPEVLLDTLDGACAGREGESDMVLAMAVNYGGRAEIVDSIRTLMRPLPPGREVDEAAISSALYTAGMPDPDLVVRPGGEVRLSNFMLWQVAYAELYFSRVLWPDFDEEELDRALSAYAQRHRRFGGL